MYVTDLKEKKIPMVEIFETVEGEGTRAGFPTTFVRVFHCNLRCSWCDTTYSYAPAKPEFWATIPEIIEQVKGLPNHHICLTGGEPLIHGKKSERLVQELSKLTFVQDIHIETNGAIHLKPFEQLRQSIPEVGSKTRFIVDYKLPASGENERMIDENFSYLRSDDEIKFVIEDQEDFDIAVQTVQQKVQKGVALFSPVWGKLEPEQLVKWILDAGLRTVKLNLQVHKYIWDPEARGV